MDPICRHASDRPLSIAEQVDFLLWRGIEVQPRAEAERILGHISFHRLRGYLESFYAQPGIFRDRVAFADIIERYNFNQELRNLLMDAFTHIEVSLRTQWAYTLAYVGGGGRLAHQRTALFGKHHGENLSRLKKEYAQRPSAKYGYRFDDCPIWAIVETMSFGNIVRWYSDTVRPARRVIAQHYGIAENIFDSLLKHLRVIRNMCAHHEQLWDRTLVSPFRLPNSLGSVKSARYVFNESARGKIYNAIIMIVYLMSLINPAAGWHQRLTALLNKYSRIPPERMGFPLDWQQRIAALPILQ